MNKDLKNKILYSDTITELITSNKAIAIYLGGSRLEGLDSPESDYDIVVLGLTDDVYCYRNKTIIIDDLKIHIQPGNIRYFIDLLNTPLETTSIWNSQFVLDFLLLKEDNLLYTTTTYNKLKQCFNKYSTEYTLFAFDKISQVLKNNIRPPFIRYSKTIYILAKYILLLTEYLNSKTLNLSKEDREYLINIKVNKELPKDIFIHYEKLKSSNYYSFMFDYNMLYNEVIKYV